MYSARDRACETLLLLGALALTALAVAGTWSRPSAHVGSRGFALLLLQVPAACDPPKAPPASPVRPEVKRATDDLKKGADTLKRITAIVFDKSNRANAPAPITGGGMMGSGMGAPSRGGNGGMGGSGMGGMGGSGMGGMGGGGGGGMYGGGGGGIGMGTASGWPGASGGYKSPLSGEDQLANPAEVYVQFAKDSAAALARATDMLRDPKTTPEERKVIAQALLAALDGGVPMREELGVPIPTVYSAVLPYGEEQNAATKLRESRDAAWTALYEHEATANDAELSRQVRDLATRLLDSAIKPFNPGAEIQAAYRRQLQNPNQKKIKRLADALTALAIASDPKMRPYTDVEAAKRDVEASFQDREVIEALAGVRKAAIYRLASSDDYKRYVAAVNSPMFMRALTLAPKAEAEAMITDVATKLALVSPYDARAFFEAASEARAASELLALSDEELANLMAELERALGGDPEAMRAIMRSTVPGENELKGPKTAADITKKTVKVADAFRKAITQAAKKRSDPAVALAQVPFGKTKVGGALSRLSAADKHGKLGALSSTLGLAKTILDYRNGKLGGDGAGNLTPEDVDAIRSVLKSVSSADAYAKWVTWSLTLTKTGELGPSTLLKGAKVLGPIGDTIGGVSEVFKALDSAKENNDWNTAWHSVAAGGYAFSTLGGVLILTPSPGVTQCAGAILVLVGATITLVANVMVGDDFIRPEEGAQIGALKVSRYLLRPSPELHAYRNYELNIPAATGEIAQAKAALASAVDILNRPKAHSPEQIANAQNVRARAEGIISRRTADLESYKAGMEKIRKDFESKGIDLRVWDGYEEYMRNQEKKDAGK